MHVFSRVLMISVNDRVCEGFAQRDLNAGLALRNAAALPETTVRADDGIELHGAEAPGRMLKS